MPKPIVIVGAGLGGLMCAKALHGSQIPFILVDTDDRPGGRMKTDIVDGFRLDRGFQVHFSAYPTASRELDVPSLDLRAFEPGALIWNGESFQEIHRRRPLTMAASNVITLADKLGLLRLNADVSDSRVDEIWQSEDQSAEKLLQSYGFSDKFFDGFARPFFGGIFLDRSLQVSSRMFLFIWKMLLEGDTVIPSNGIEEIPRQIANGLPANALRMSKRVVEVLRTNGQATGIKLETGESLSARAVVIATDGPEANRLTGIDLPNSPGKTSTCVYFEAPRPISDRKMLYLNGLANGLVNEVVPVSTVVPNSAPPGKLLTSVTILSDPGLSDDALALAIKNEVAAWFPTAQVPAWRHLKTYRIPFAQMAQPPGFYGGTPRVETDTPGLFFAGEFATHGSIEGSMIAGLAAADAIRAMLRKEAAA